MILKRQQIEDLVIKLAEEGGNTKDIVQVGHVSLKDMGTIIRRYTGEGEDIVYQDKGLSINSSDTVGRHTVSEYHCFPQNILLPYLACGVVTHCPFWIDFCGG